MRLLQLLGATTLATTGVCAATNKTCKTTPYDIQWPSEEDWASLNTSIAGSLIKSSPVASSCYAGNPFNSAYSCEVVEEKWTSTTFHASLAESIDSPIYANNSCLPPNASGFTEQRGCSVGALPQYIVNGTTEEQVATAMAWAAERNIRIIIKGTGHDLNGRSSGAFSMSIWTHNFRNIEFNSEWQLPGSNSTADVMVAGSGNNWLRIYTAAEEAGKVIVGGGATTVGLGGFIQGGGHGPMSSHYGLAADQILQARVVTTEGKILVANSQENQYLLFAIRGGGAGQYGVVTEYVLKAYPAPTSAVVGTLSLSTNGTDSSSLTAAWNAFAIQMQGTLDMMDAGLAGALIATTKILENGSAVPTVSHGLMGYNMTAAEMTALVAPIMTKMQAQGGNTSLAVTFPEPTVYPNFTSMFLASNPSDASAGSGSLMSSRLLGRKHLTAANITQAQLVNYLQRIMVSQSPTGGGYLIAGMQGGKGPANVPLEMRGALNPSWRTAYLHTISLGATINATADPKTSLASAAAWVNAVKEPIWQEWAPEMGSYMNEANPYNPWFKTDYYGANYDKLVEIKRKYDPSESLFVLTGVGSDAWDYDLHTGKLCRTG